MIGISWLLFNDNSFYDTYFDNQLNNSHIMINTDCTAIKDYFNDGVKMQLNRLMDVSVKSVFIDMNSSDNRKLKTSLTNICTVRLY